MKQVYPIILTPDEREGYMVRVPDLNIDTHGSDMADAIVMARDAISILCIDFLEDGKKLPDPSGYDTIEAASPAFKTLVDIDLKKYRREHDTRAVRKNCTIPSWLNDEASAAGINFSSVLQDALKAQLGIE